DNADLLLTPRGHGYTISEERHQRLVDKQNEIDKEIKRLEKYVIAPSAAANELLRRYDSTEIAYGFKLSELVRRPELSYDILASLDPNRPNLPINVTEQVNIAIKYEGYIKKQMLQVEQFKKLERRILPADVDYDDVGNLRMEARQKLKDLRPANIGQASRITGVSPADISNLLIYLEKRNRLGIKGNAEN
ncbi:MAG: tRNA uridine-5-carboxymethylaminomethyl(34) synthesis enzyme MnmG, partial [Defluviitaleaceae bacterium]|nr:tRNA uridine-5-carboxymethylaminomethyl(34) synthesis enzyme MnmG [Defluviitaleaceae bacterium]